MFLSLSALFHHVQRVLGLGRHRLLRKLRRNGVRPDILLPGHIVIDISRMVLFNIDQEVTVRFAEINGIDVGNQGEEGFMDSYVLSVDTTRYDMPRLEWRISNVRRDAEQVARIIDDVLSGALLTADSKRLPASTKALSGCFASI
ncbi:MAG TPA: hypothetical protein VM661_12025 [Candidatus Sulfotelmatobacter sp.]|jgi:hypothetical protein|nr:hypothetical protein [Candidatus Sulfotelmatobacter sp.]